MTNLLDAMIELVNTIPDDCWTISIIYSYDNKDGESEQGHEALLYDKDQFSQLTEARVMRDLLNKFDDDLIDRLYKVSMCIYDAKDKGVADWLECKNSPLYDGKLWLHQHRWTN